MITTLEQQLRRDEGEVLHAYKDSLGYVTLGVGRLIDAAKGGGITPEESAYLLANDIRSHTADVVRCMPWSERLDPVRFAVLVNMSFQLGVTTLMTFKTTLGFVKSGDYESAGANMLLSKWHDQTPERCERLAKQMVIGEWQ